MNIMLRIKTDNPEMIHDLVDAWLEDEGATIRLAGHSYPVDITYVKEQ